jgi:hypothetical protein
MLITVQVSQDNIDDSDVEHPRLCPIALALKEMVVRDTQVRVYGSSLHIGDDSWDFNSQIPYQLNSEHYDHSDFTKIDLEPFSFTMEMPGHYFNEYDNEDDDDDSDDDDNPQDEDQRPYTVNFLKNGNGDYMVRDRDGETVILTVDQIEKLYKLTRTTERVWQNL